MSHHIHQRGAPQAHERQEVIHINTDWRGRAKPGPWYGRYYQDWDAAHPEAWVRGQAVPGRFYAGALEKPGKKTCGNGDEAVLFLRHSSD